MLETSDNNSSRDKIGLTKSHDLFMTLGQTGHPLFISLNVCICTLNEDLF